MAHFPRWIDDETVDSTALYTAYLGVVTEVFQNRMDRPAWMSSQPSLPCEIHQGRVPRSAKQLNCVVVDVPCTTKNCQRCEKKLGGYKFRWYCADFENVYRQQAKAGAWMPDGS